MKKNTKPKAKAKKISRELLELSIKYNIIHEILDSLKNKKGKWWTESESKAEPPLWPTKDSKIIYMSRANAIVDAGDGTLYVGDCGQFECPITDPELLELINAIRPKQKKVAKKKKAQPKNDYKNATYIDVFKRVCSYMTENTGFVPSIYEYNKDYDENTEVDICLDYDGMVHEGWCSVRGFVGGYEDEESIFETIDAYDCRYDKLTRWYAEFCDACRSLKNVELTKDRTPAGIMKALDKAGI